MPSADAAARRIPACRQLCAASLLLREMCRVPGVVAVPPCREGVLQVLQVLGVPELWIFQFWSRRSPHGEVSVAQWTSALDF